LRALTGWGWRKHGRVAHVLLRGLLIAGFGLPLPGAAVAGKFPSRPVTLIVPFPPGGPTDVVARLMLERLASFLGQSVLIENRVGGVDGADGALAAAAARPDGHTLFFGTPGSLAIAPAVYPKIGYGPARTFAPVAMVAISPQVLTVSASVPAKSVHDLIVYAKAKPGKMSFASPGYGTQPHLLGELLNTTAAIKLVHTTYDGSAAALVDLLAGRVQVAFSGTAMIAPYIAAGRLRALAVASETRAKPLPDVPTMIESGFGRFIASYWICVAAPVGTPAHTIGRLNAAINDTLRASDVQASLGRLGAEPKLGTPQDAGAFVAAEAQKWAVVAKAAGVRAP
jgi:tripartite-type tricarboxylate transporter receptor subunit TctC